MKARASWARKKRTPRLDFVVRSGALKTVAVPPAALTDSSLDTQALLESRASSDFAKSLVTSLVTRPSHV